MIWLLLIFFLVLLAMGIPVVFSMGISGLIYIFLFVHVPIEVIAHRVSFGLYSWPLLAIPFYILAGMLLSRGGITGKIFDFVNSVIGHITGGLGHANVLASIIFAGISGSAAADAGGLGRIEMDAMLKEGYDIDFSAAITAASSCIGPIFPPSISLIIYGAIAEQSVTRLFAGGVIPGLLMGLLLMIIVYILAKTGKVVCPVQPRMPVSVMWKRFKEGFFCLMTPVIILTGIMSGVFTPTEAGIAACVYAFILGFTYRELKLSDFPAIFKEATAAIAMPMYIIAVSSIFSWVVIAAQIPNVLADFILGFTHSHIVILLFLSVLMFIAGCFIEPVAILLIFAPIFIPIAKAVGIDLIHLGLIMALNMTIATMTPPVGMGLFILSDMTKRPIEKIFLAAWEMLVALNVSLVLIIIFPESVLWLSRMVK